MKFKIQMPSFVQITVALLTAFLFNAVLAFMFVTGVSELFDKIFLEKNIKVSRGPSKSDVRRQTVTS